MAIAGSEKDLNVIQAGNLYFIQYSGGGKVPSPLEGMYTSPDIANQFITNYKAKAAKAEQAKLEAIKAAKATADAKKKPATKKAG